MSENPKFSKIFQLSTWVRLSKRCVRKLVRISQPIIEKAIYLGGISEYLAVIWLLRIYKSKFRIDWEFSKTPPHFYDHRMGMAQFALCETMRGAYSYYRGFFASQVIQNGDKLLDIGCGDGFFTKRFFSVRCSHVDGIDIEPSAISCAQRNNGAKNIKYYLLDAVKEDFPEREYDVIVWDGAIGHFSSDTLATMLRKIMISLSADGIFVGSESLGDESADHLTRFDSLEDFAKLFSDYFRYVEVSSNDYAIDDNFVRREAYWRCANSPSRLQKLAWKTYYGE